MKPPKRVGVEIDVSDTVAALESWALALFEEESRHGLAEGLSEDEVNRRARSAICKFSYRDEAWAVAPSPDGFRERMAARMGCSPDDVDREMAINEAVSRVDTMHGSISLAIEEENDLASEAIRSGTIISDEQAKARFIAAVERGWSAALKELSED